MLLNFNLPVQVKKSLKIIRNNTDRRIGKVLLKIGDQIEDCLVPNPVKNKREALSTCFGPKKLYKMYKKLFDVIRLVLQTGYHFSIIFIF